MKMNEFLIEQLGILRIVVVIFDISVCLVRPFQCSPVYGALKTGDLKDDIPDPAHGVDFWNIKC